MVKNPKNIKLSWGKGRSELTILKPEIQRLLKENKTAKKVYDYLVEKHKFVGTKRTVERFVAPLKAQIIAEEEASKLAIGQRTSKKIIRRKETKTDELGSPFEHDAESVDSMDMWE